MRPSIRTFLLINLLLSVTLTTSLAVIGNLFLEHRDLETHLDTKLTETAFTLAALTDHSFSPTYYRYIQDKINAIPDMRNQLFESNAEKILAPSYQKVQFQIWSKDNTLLLHSYNSPKQPLFDLKPGFNDFNINDISWRAFITVNQNTGTKVVVAEQYNFRNLIQDRVTKDSIFIMLVTYPLLGLFIWIIVGRGLQSLSKITYEVSHRALGYLEPFDIEPVPVEIRPLIEELNHLFFRLQDGFNREKRFAADAAHELRTPLAALRAQTQVALKAAGESERQIALQKVLTGVDRATHVMQQLLILSRMVPEAVIENIEIVDIARQATDVIVDLAPEAIKKQTEIELLVAPEKLAVIEGNTVAIGILIRNLVINAVRYTPEGSLVKVVIEEEPSNIILKVIDNGPGIPEELRERVFERFFRIIGKKAHGSGLGLGIVQRIAELHQANIQLGSPESGQGLEVTIIFPKKLKV